MIKCVDPSVLGFSYQTHSGAAHADQSEPRGRADRRAGAETNVNDLCDTNVNELCKMPSPIERIMKKFGRVKT